MKPALFSFNFENHFWLSGFALLCLAGCSLDRFSDVSSDGSGEWDLIARHSSDRDTKRKDSSPEDEAVIDAALGEDSPEIKETLSLSECIDKALDLNRKRPASLAAVSVAEAQHQQALASFWPHLTLQGNANLRSSDPNFVFPAQDFALPATTLGIPGQSMTFPASTFATPATTFTTPSTNIKTPPSSMTLPLGPGGAPVTVPIPGQTVSVPPQALRVPSQKISVPAQTFDVPASEFTVPSQNFHLEEQDIKVMDRRTVGGQLDLKWLLWNAGWRQALNDQSKDGIDAAREDSRRTDLEIVYDVRRLYAASVMAREIEGLGRDTLSRMEATLELTESLYQGGSMQVKKTDYLRNKVLVEGLRSMVNRLEENVALSESALVNSMGLSWRSTVHPKSKSLSFEPVKAPLESLVTNTYAFSPDWRQLEIGLSAAESKIREEKAGFFPRIALIGNMHAVDTPYQGGYATDQNLNAWNIGVGVELPLFDGFLTKARVAEARARLDELKEKKILLKEGLALQVKAQVIQLDSMQRQDQNNSAAVATATENRNLTEKAYRNDLIEADKVFESQIMEAITKARRLKLRFDHAVTKAKLDLVIGKNFQEQLGTGITGNTLAAQ